MQRELFAFCQGSRSFAVGIAQIFGSSVTFSAAGTTRGRIRFHSGEVAWGRKSFHRMGNAMQLGRNAFLRKAFTLLSQMNRLQTLGGCVDSRTTSVEVRVGWLESGCEW